MAWADSVGAHWEKIEAEYNAEWAKLAYLDGPGYTVWDRIEAKFDLRRKYFSGSSSHGVQNSIEEAPIQSCSSHLISSMAESNREHNSRMADSAREIRESCARILKLLQEETESTKSTSDAVPASSEILLSVERIEEHSVTNESVQVKNLTMTSVSPSIDFNGGIVDLPEETRQKCIDTPESFGGRKTVVKTSFADSFRFEPLIIDSKSFTRTSVDQGCRKETLLDMDNKKQSPSVVIPIVRPSPEPPDCVVIPTLPLSASYYPYDPGPASSPPLTNVSYPHYSFQFQYEELPANPSQCDKEIVLQTITMLIKKSTHEAGVVARVFHLPIPVCSIDVLFGYDIRTSVAYTNIEISSEAHYVFVKMPLKTNFSCGTLKSLVCGIQIHASFVHAEIAMSDTLELVMFLLNAKLGMVAFDCQFMELRMVWLIIIDVGSTYSDLVLRHLVDDCSWLSKSRYMLYVYLHFVDVERLVQNSLGRFTVPESDQSHGYNLCTLMLLATILATCSTHPFSHHVLEAAANCVLERRKLNYISSDILINMFLGDGSLVAALMVKVVNEKVLYEYPANSALEIHLPQCTRNCLDMYWYSHLIFAAETISVAFLHYEKSSPILCYDIKSSCILAKDDLSAIIASMGLLYCVVTSNLQWYLNCQCLHFCKTSISNMHAVVLLGILHPVPISQFHYSEPSFGPCGYYNLDGRCYGVPQIVLNSMKIRQEVSDIYGIEISHWWPKTTKQSILQTITILSNHFKKWDTNGNGCFFYNKGFLQFQQWDPGGCSLLHGEGPLDLEATQKDTIITQQHCANFNLEDKVDLNGGSNVMIENGI